jgi:hypothetical protein
VGLAYASRWCGRCKGYYRTDGGIRNRKEQKKGRRKRDAGCMGQSTYRHGIDTTSLTSSCAVEKSCVRKMRERTVQRRASASLIANILIGGCKRLRIIVRHVVHRVEQTCVPGKKKAGQKSTDSDSKIRGMALQIMMAKSEHATFMN